MTSNPEAFGLAKQMISTAEAQAKVEAAGGGRKKKRRRPEPVVITRTVYVERPTPEPEPEAEPVAIVRGEPSALVLAYRDAFADLVDELVLELGFNRKCNGEELETLRERLRAEQEAFLKSSRPDLDDAELALLRQRCGDVNALVLMTARLGPEQPSAPRVPARALALPPIAIAVLAWIGFFSMFVLFIAAVNRVDPATQLVRCNESNNYEPCKELYR